MQSLYKRKYLTDLYANLEQIKAGNITLRQPVEVKEMNQGMALKIYTSTEPITLFFYPGHPVSEFNIIRNGMRLIYPRRVLKFKRHTIGDMMDVISKDDRMRGYTRVVDIYMTAIMKNCDMYMRTEISS